MTFKNVNVKKSTNNKCWTGGKEKRTLPYRWWECKSVQPLWKTVWRFLKNLELPCYPAIPLLGIYPNKTTFHKDTSTSMFTAGLFIIVKTWKQSKCPSTEEWIENMWYINTREYHSAMKNNEIVPFTTTWMDLGFITPNDANQKKDNKYHMTYLYVESKMQHGEFPGGPVIRTLCFHCQGPGFS